MHYQARPESDTEPIHKRGGSRYCVLGEKDKRKYSVYFTQLPTDSTYYYVLEVVAERRFSPRTPICVRVLVYHRAVVCTSAGVGTGM